MFRITKTAGVALVALITLPVALAGCSTNTAASGGGDANTITVAQLNDTGMRKVVAGFEKENPGKHVKLDTIDANSYQQLLTTQLVGGTAPDLIRTYPGNGSNLAVKVAGDKKYFTDLSDQKYASSFDATTKKLLVGSNGDLYGIPLTKSAIGAVYNIGAVKAAGLSEPTTWPEVLSFCAAAKAKGKVAFGLGLKDAWSGQLIPYALTASLVYGKNPDFVEQQLAKKADFENSAWKTAFEKYLEMNKAGCFNTSPNGTAYSQVEDEVRKGDTLSMVSIVSEVSSLKTGGPAGLQLSVAPLPATDTAADTDLSATLATTYSLNAKAKNQALGKKFLAYLMKPEVQARYAADTGDAPAITAAGEKSSSQVDALIAKYSEDGKTAPWPDQQWPNATVQSTHFDVVQAMFTGSLTVPAALKKMDDAFYSGD